MSRDANTAQQESDARDTYQDPVMQSTSSDELTVTGSLALRYGAQYYKIQDSLIRQTASQVQTKARERNESNAERALDKANQAIAK